MAYSKISIIRINVTIKDDVTFRSFSLILEISKITNAIRADARVIHVHCAGFEKPTSTMVCRLLSHTHKRMVILCQTQIFFHCRFLKKTSFCMSVHTATLDLCIKLIRWGRGSMLSLASLRNLRSVLYSYISSD